jgi:hypothetical protein
MSTTTVKKSLTSSYPGGFATGSGPSDTFTFNPGDGVLQVVETDNVAGDANILVFGSGILPSQIGASTDPLGNITLTDGTAGDKVFINAFASQLPTGGISAIQFADGTTWNTTQVVEVISTYQSAIGTGAAAGNLSAGVTTLVNGGSTTDITNAIAAAANQAGAAFVQAVGSTQPGALWLTRSGDDLIVGTLGSTQTTTVTGWFTNTGLQLPSVSIAGKSVTAGQIDDAVQVMATYQQQTGFNPSAANATTPLDTLAIQTAYIQDLGLSSISGGAGNDTVLLAGSDTVSGGGGFDTYNFDYGSGACVISPPSSSAFQSWATAADDSNGPPWNGQIKFGANVSASNVTFSRVTGANIGSDLVITLNGTSDSVTLTGWFNATGLETVTSFSFSDGTSVSANAVWAAVKGTTGVLPVVVTGTLNQTTDASVGETVTYGDAASNVVFTAQNNFITFGRGNDTISMNSGVHDTGFSGDDSPPSNLLVVGSGVDTVSINEDYDEVVQHGGGIILNITGNNNLLLKSDTKPTATTSPEPAQVMVDGNGNSLRFLNGEGQTLSDTSASTNTAFVLNNSTNAVINVLGSDDVVFLNGGTNERIVDQGTGLTVFLAGSTYYGANGPTVTIANAAADPSLTIELGGGVGGYASASSALGQAVSDGSGGSLLALGTGSLHLLNVTQSALNTLHFSVTGGVFAGIGY